MERTESKVLRFLSERFAPVARPTHLPPSVPCPNRQLVDGWPAPNCRQTAVAPSSRLVAAVADVLEAVPEGPSALRLWGLLSLARAQPAAAVEHFRDALDWDVSGGSHNDLAAALLIQSALEKRPELLGEALEHSTLAVVMDPTLVEAHHNRAFALASLGLRGAARSAWAAAPNRTGLEADIADAYGRALASPAPSFGLSDRSRGEQSLGLWAERSQAGQPTADTALARATSLATRAAEQGDHTLFDAVRLAVGV